MNNNHSIIPNFETKIGIEIHVVVNTKTKMFSSSKSNHNDPVNTNINEIDLALPGALPSVNKEAIIKAIQLANAFHMQIQDQIIFDRKNYFYHDLPKGFQITQQYFPIGKNGTFDVKSELNIEDQSFSIGIERIHIEEDTAKQLSIDNKLCLDYNRCGMPLIEIVSKPEINSSIEASLYLTQIKRLLNFLEISDAKMEDGSLRADINISHNLIGSKMLGNKVEIKNLNSISNVIKAIEFESSRQTKMLLLGKSVPQETRRWDEVTGETVFMRSKEDSVDYHYFTEPNILSLQLTDEFKDEAMNLMNIIPNQAQKNLIEIGFHRLVVLDIINDYTLYKFIKRLIDKGFDWLQITTWFLTELASLANKDNLRIYQVNNEIIKNIERMVIILKENKINAKQAKTILLNIYNSNKTCEEIIKEFNFKQINDELVLEKMLLNHIKNNPEMMSQYNERPERVEKYILGLVMKETNGQANPIISTNILKKLLTK